MSLRTAASLPSDAANASTPAFDAAYFRVALGRFATGVTIITTQTPDGQPIGLTVNSFSSVSLNPPLILWSLSLTASSREFMQHCPRYAVNVLSADHGDVARQFSTRRLLARFDGLDIAHAPGGTPLIHGATTAWFECRNRSRYQEGDHLIMVGEVEHCGHNDEPPLIFHAGSFALTPTPALA